MLAASLNAVYKKRMTHDILNRNCFFCSSKPNLLITDFLFSPFFVLRCNQCVALASSSARGSEDEIRWTRLGELLTEEQSEEGGAHQKSGWFEMEGERSEEEGLVHKLTFR